MKYVYKNGKLVALSDSGKELDTSSAFKSSASVKPSTVTSTTANNTTPKTETPKSNTPKSESADEFWDNYYSKNKATAEKVKSEKAAKESAKETKEFWNNYYTQNKQAAAEVEKRNPSKSVYEQKVAETKAVEKAWGDYAAEEKKAESVKLRNEAAVRRDEQLQLRQKELEKSYQEVEKLKQAYLASGDQASEQAYIEAAEKHNSAVGSYQKLLSAQKQAVQNINDQNANLEKLYQNYETKHRKWQASQPENASEKEIRNMISQLDAQIEAANKAVTPMFDKVSSYSNLGMAAELNQAQSELEQTYSKLEDLKNQKAYWQGYLEQRQAKDWEQKTTSEILNLGGSELMSALLNYAKETEFNQRFTFNKGVQQAAKDLKDMGVTDAQLEQWLPYAQRMVQAQNYNRQSDVAKEIAQSSRAAEVAMSALSVPYNLTGGFGIVDVTLQKLNQKITGDDTPINYKTQGMVGHGIANAIRTGVTENIEARTQGKAGSDTFMGNLHSGAYNLVMSMADSLGVVGLTALGVPGATVLLGGSAATASMVEVKERGGSDAQALAMGWLAGAAETLFEEVSIENLITAKPPKGWGDWKTGILNILAQGGTEASEEACTTIANTLVDMVIMGDKSQLELSVQYFMAEENMTREQAEKAAKSQWWAGLLGDIIGGFVSGGVFGVGGNIAGIVKNNKLESMFAQEERSRQGDNAWIASVRDHAAEGSEIRKLAEQIYEKKMANEDVPLSDLNRLAELTQEDVARFKNDPKQQEVLEKLAKTEAPAVQEYAAAQMTNPDVKVVSPYAQELMDSGMKPEQAVAQAALIEKVVAGEALSKAEQKQLMFTLPAVRQVFEKATGVPVNIEQSRKQVFKSAQEIAQQKQEAKAAEAAAKFVEQTTAPAVEETAQFAEESAPAPASVAATTDNAEVTTDTTPYQFSEESAPAPSAPKRAPFVAANQTAPGRQAAEAALGSIVSEASERGPVIEFADGTTLSQKDFVQRYLADNKQATKAEAVAAFREYQAFNRLGQKIHGTAADKVRRRSSAKPSSRAGQISEDIYTGKALSESAQQTERDLTMAELNRMASKFGVKVELREADGKDLNARENGYYDIGSKTIVLNSKRATNQYLLTRYFVHELTHHGQQIDSSVEGGLTAHIISAMEKIHGKEKVEQLIKETRAAYEKHLKLTGEDLSKLDKPNYIKDEVAADFMMEAIANRALLDRLASVTLKPHQALIQRAKDFLSGRSRGDVGVKEAKRLIDRMQKSMATAEKNKNTATESGGKRLSIDPEFTSDVDEWVAAGKPEDWTLVLGSTGDVLQGLGAVENDIYVRSEKMARIMEDHPEMGVDELKKLPQVMDGPVLVLKSKNRQGSVPRLIVFGNYKATNGKPILGVLDLRPNEKGYTVDDMQKLSSAYTKDNDPKKLKYFFEHSEVLYADKNKTTALLKTLGLYTPSELQNSGYVGSITYQGQEVKVEGVPFSSIVPTLEADKDLTVKPEKRLSIDRETGYEEGSVQDRVLKLLDAGTPEEAIQLLQKWSEDVKAGKVEVQEGEKAIAEQMKAHVPVTEEEAIANRKKLDELIEKYGKIRTGEKAAWNAPFPKKVDHLEGVSKHAQTVAEYAGTPEWMRVEIEKAVVNKQAGFSYHIVTDDAAMAYVDSLHNQDFNSLMEQWNKVVGGNTRVGKMDIALGEYLYTQAVRRGDMTTAIQLISELCAIGTQAGQTVQAMSLLKKMTPAGQLYYLQKAVDRMNEKASKTPPKLTEAEAKQRSELTKQKAAAEREVEQANAEYDEAIEILHETEKLLESAKVTQAEVEQAEADTRRAETQLKKILEALDKVDSEVLMSEFEAAQGPLEEAKALQREVRRTEAATRRAEAQTQKKLEELDKVDSEVLMAEFEEAQGQLEEVKALEREVRRAEKQVEATKKRLAEKDIEAIKKKAFATKAELEKVKALEAEAKKAEAELRRAEKQLAAAQERLSKYDTEGTKAKTAETRGKVDYYRALLKEAKAAEAALERAEARLDKLTDEWEAGAEDRAKVAADLAAAKEAIRDMYDQRADFRKLKETLKRAEATLERLNTEWVKMKPARTATEAQLAAIRKRVEEAKAEKASKQGKLNEIKKAIKKLNEQIEERNADALFKWGHQPMIHIDARLAEQLLNAKSEKEMNEARELLLQHIADQVPVTWAEKWNAWRYLAMLGNPKTHVRNLISNAVFQPVVFMKDMVGAVAEGISMHGKQKQNRTKHLGQAVASAFYGISPFSKVRIKGSKYVSFADQDYLEMKDILTGGGKHNVADEIRDKRKIFGKKGPGAALEWVSQTNSKLMEKEDAVALQTHYVRALSQYLAAHKADVKTLNSTPEGLALLSKARAWAVQEAQKATFRDASKLATALNRLEKNGGVGGQLLVGSVLPFKKTPINILKRGVEYSPLGIVKAIKDAVKSKGDASKFVDSLSATLTGSAIMYVGFYLASQGLLRAGGSDDERERKFEELWGEQSYSFKLADGTSYTIDWMAPAALPLFVGVEWFNMVSGQKDGEFSAVDFIDALSMLSGPMFQLSMLDGLSSTLKAAGYGDNPVVDVGLTMMTNYFTQAIPTLWGQINRTFFDDTSRGTFIQSGTRMQIFQRAYQTSVMGKIPGMSDERVPYLDAWGRAETQSNLLMRALENFLSPGYASKTEKSAMEDELLRLYKVTGEGGVLPSTVAKYFNVDRDEDGDGVLESVRHNLTADEWVTYQTTTGQMAYQLITELVNSAGYAQLTDAEKVRAIESLYDYANEQGRAAAVSDYKIDVSWMEKVDGLMEKGVSLTEFVAINARDKESKDLSMVEDLLGMTWLDDADRANYIAASYGKKLSDEGSIADPDKSYYEYILSGEQQQEYLQHFDEQWMKDYTTLVNSSYFKGATLEDQAAMIEATRNQSADLTQQWMAGKLTAKGIKSTQIPDFDTRALRNCSKQEELTRLYGLTGETKVLPKEMTRDFTADEHEYKLDAQQWLKAQEVKENTANDILNRTAGSDMYKKLTDDQRVFLIGKIHTYSTEMGKEAAGVGYESKEVAKIKDLEEKGVTVERFYTANALCDETSGQDTLDLVNMDWLTDEERAWIVASKYEKSLESGNTFTDKNKRKHQFVMTEEQTEEYLARYDELYIVEYRKLLESWKYKNGDAEERAELIDDMKSDVCNDVKKEFSNYLPTVGNYSVPKE